MNKQVRREWIEEQLNGLLEIESTARGAAAVVELDPSRQGLLSRMDALQGQAMAHAGNQRRRWQIRRLRLALERLEQDDYGFCTECAQAIAAPRLQADPAATLCIKCATARER